MNKEESSEATTSISDPVAPARVIRRRSIVAFNANPLAPPEEKSSGRATEPVSNTHKFRASIMNGSLAMADVSEVDLLVADLNSCE